MNQGTTVTIPPYAKSVKFTTNIKGENTIVTVTYNNKEVINTTKQKTKDLFKHKSDNQPWGKKNKNSKKTPDIFNSNPQK